MAVFGPVKSFTSVAVADLTNNLYHIVRHAGENQTNIASNAAAAFSVGAIGVLQNNPNSGQHVTIGYAGESKVVAGGSISAGVQFTTNASGRATAAASGDLVVGRALTAAGANGQIFRALLTPTWRLNGAV